MFKDAILARTTVEARAVINTKIEIDAIAYKPLKKYEQTAKGDINVIKLLGRQTSGNVQKVLFALEEIGVKYTREDYGRQFNNTQTPEYKKLNPNSKVPTLIDGDTVIWEIQHHPALSRGAA